LMGGGGGVGGVGWGGGGVVGGVGGVDRWGGGWGGGGRSIDAEQHCVRTALHSNSIAFEQHCKVGGLRAA